MNRSTFLRLGLWLLVCLAAVVLGCWLRAVNAPEWLRLDTGQDPPVLRAWPVEADCYSQLARVQRILHGDGLIQNHFKVENWPEGLVPSTTAPFDYAILLLYAPLTLVTKYPLDWAGALVSPALWLGLVLFWMLFRSREFNLTGRTLLIIGSAVLPAIIWGTACGRSRHQSLILTLLAIALTAEYERWHIELSHKRAWNIVAGIVWGLACWTSIFEPLILIFMLVVYNLIVRRRETAGFLISFGVVLLIMMLLEGSHVIYNIVDIYNLTPQYRQYSLNWLSGIAEVQGMSFTGFMYRMTLIVIFLPLIAWRLLAREGDRRTDLFVTLITTFLIIASALQSRWFYYAALGEVFLIVRYCQIEPLRWSRLLVLGVFFAGVVDADYVQVVYSKEIAPNQPSIDLAEIARSIDQPGGIMAPWWLSPGLLYFSGQPIVAGSSHSGISGIVASAKFFASTSWTDAEQILRERQVRWIVVYDDQDDPDYLYPVLNNSRQILGLDPYNVENEHDANSTVWQILINDQPEYMPRDLRLRAVTSQFKLYEYEPGL